MLKQSLHELEKGHIVDMGNIIEEDFDRTFVNKKLTVVYCNPSELHLKFNGSKNTFSVSGVYKHK